MQILNYLKKFQFLFICYNLQNVVHLAGESFLTSLRELSLTFFKSLSIQRQTINAKKPPMGLGSPVAF